MKTTKRIKDIKGVVKRQHLYSTLAKKESKYAEKKEKEEKRKGLKEMAKDSERERKLGLKFSKVRSKWADQEARKLPKKKIKK